MDPAPRCLFFDVFGTCVDWRTTVTNELWGKAKEALSSPSASIASEVRAVAEAMTYEDWGEVAQEWRNGYLSFTRALASDPNIPWKSVDEHHHDSLREILTQRRLLLWTDPTLQSLSQIWHHLAPWPDSAAGLARLNTKFTTSTLSNGNVSLLQDLVSVGPGLPFTHVLSAEMFSSYKPSPAVYLGAAEKLGFRAEECALVAAHLDDLKAAKGCGFGGAFYVERAREERRPELGEEGFVDVWIREGDGGFEGLAERLGC